MVIVTIILLFVVLFSVGYYRVEEIRKESLIKGYKEGVEYGYKKGYEDGYNQGDIDGVNNKQHSNYSRGYNDARTNTVTCVHCDGRGVKACFHCNGIGCGMCQNTGLEKCYLCNGRGWNKY